MRHSLLLLLLSLPLAIAAQGDAARQTAWALAVGRASIVDTYLSPQHYSGAELRIINTTETANRANTWLTQWAHNLVLADAEPRSRSANYLAALYALQLARLKQMPAPAAVDGLRWWVGAEAETTVGCLYNSRGGNNPVQLRLALAVAPKVKCTYPVRLFGRDILAAYEGAMPLVGLAFAPQYGQSYYEIFARGDFDHNIRPTTPFNALSYSQRLTFDLPLGRGALRLGYLGDYRQQRLNNIRSHHFTHSLLIGWRL